MKKLKKNYLNIPTVETKRLILNSPLEEDYAIIQKFLKSERSKFIGGPYSDFTSWTDYMANIGHWSLFGYGLWSVRIKTNNKLIGRVGIINPPMFSEPDLAWQLFAGFEGKGYAYEAARCIKEFALKSIKLSSLASHILIKNKKSILLAEKLSSLKKEITLTNRRFIVYIHI
jgi:RimJ/RimL family protein N-acetyltransferase